jgi:hypothetical protein
LRNVKADDSHGIDVLAFQQIGDHTLEVGIFEVGLAPRGTPFAVKFLILIRGSSFLLSFGSIPRNVLTSLRCMLGLIAPL